MYNRGFKFRAQCPCLFNLLLAKLILYLLLNCEKDKISKKRPVIGPLKTCMSICLPHILGNVQLVLNHKL